MVRQLGDAKGLAVVQQVHMAVNEPRTDKGPVQVNNGIPFLPKFQRFGVGPREGEFPVLYNKRLDQRQLPGIDGGVMVDGFDIPVPFSIPCK